MKLSADHPPRYHQEHYRQLELSDDSVVYRLSGSLNLHSLAIKHFFISSKECRAVTRPVKSILLSCPNLRKLKLDIATHRSPPPSRYCGFGFKVGERPPPLEELIVVAYPFGRLDTIYPTPNYDDIPSVFYYQGYPEGIDKCDYWIQTFDWSRLKRLQAPFPSLALDLMPKVNAMEAVSLLRGRSSVSIESILLNHGRMLRKLEVHMPEHRYRRNWGEEAPDNAYLRRIRDSCPRLEELAIDVDRANSWPYGTLYVLTTSYVDHLV